MADANSYADVADGDAYHDGHLYATAWTGATAANKAVALVMASRLIDLQYQFNGLRSVDSQALQWPRVNCLDPDKAPVPVLTSCCLPIPSCRQVSYPRPSCRLRVRWRGSFYLPTGLVRRVVKG